MTTNAKKTPRNALCPCGSGRKFKRCCLRREDGLSRKLTSDVTHRGQRNRQRFVTKTGCSLPLGRITEPRRDMETRVLRGSAGGFWLPHAHAGLHVRIPAQKRDSQRPVRGAGSARNRLPREAFVQRIQDTADAGSREGELLLAIQRRKRGRSRRNALRPGQSCAAGAPPAPGPVA